MWSTFSFVRWVRRFRAGAVKPRTVRRAALHVEGLEDRSVPAAASVNLSTILAAQQDFAGPLARAGYDLALLNRDFQVYTANSGLSPDSYVPLNSLLQVSHGSVTLDVLPSGDTSTARADLEALGFHTLAQAKYVISGTLPIAALASAAALSSVQAIQAAYKPITNIGSVTSQGVKAQQSDKVTSFLGLDGTGKTVGVISDSFNLLGGAGSDVGTGDLPGSTNPFNHLTPVNVVREGVSGSDEGRAMLQIVHDVAPGANLAFASAGSTQTQFTQSIADLFGAGVNVFVDDLTFLSEPMFLDGLIAQAVDQVASVDVPYFSAAGNLGRASYEQAFRNSGTDLTGTGAYKVPAALSPTFLAHNFGGGDLFQTITLPPGTTNFSFQWSDPFKSVNGVGAQTNLNLAVFDMAGNFMNATGGFTQNAGADPVEVFSIANSTNAPMQVQFAIGKVSGPDPILLKYVAFQPSGTINVSIDEYATNSSTLFGHANAAGAESIGAALYSNTPPYGQNPPLLESYSSRGGTPILYGSDGMLLPVPQTRQSPDVVAPDGVSTTFFGQPNGSGSSFFGTSAAAPHAAGVAALMLQAKTHLSARQIFTALETTAIDIGPAGYDVDSGWGLINASAAIISLNAGPYAVTFEGTSGSDIMLVRRDASGSKLEFLLGGVVQLAIPANQVASIAVNGRGGNDSLTLDHNNGAIDRAVAYDGSTGTDSLLILGTVGLPAEINAFANTAAVPTITVTSGTVPPVSFTSVEAATLTPTNGIVNLLGDNNTPTGQADNFVVRGTGVDAFTASLNGSPPIQFLGASSLNAYGRTLTDTFAVSPWASNSPTGWGVQTYFDGGNATDSDLLVYNTVTANPVSEDIAIQPATVGAGEIRVANASDASAIAIISYVNTDLSVNHGNSFSSDTDTLTLRGTNSPEVFAIDMLAAATAQLPMVDVKQSGGGSLYRLRSFSGFSMLGILGLGGSDTVDLLAGRDDGSVSLDIDLGLPAGGPNPSDRDRIEVFGTNGASDRFRYSPGAGNAGHIEIARSTASASTSIDFRNVETAGFNGGTPTGFSSTGADRIAIDGTSGSDTFALTTTNTLVTYAQVNAGPLLDFTNLGTSGSTYALEGLDGSDAFTIVQSSAWNIASLTIDGGSGSNDSVNVIGSVGDDRYTYTPSTTTLAVEAPIGGSPLPYFFANIKRISIDALGHVGGDRLVVTEPVGYTPTANSGTFPTDPPLSYRNVEFFNVDQLPTLSEDNATTLEDNPILIDVLANDTGIGDGPIVLSIANPPTRGSAVVVGNSIRYIPDPNTNDYASGPDEFTYQVTDGNGDTSTALVRVHVAPVNDPPTATSQSLTALEDGATSIALQGDDGDPEIVQGLTFAIVGGPAHGTITAFDPSTGKFTYTAAADYSGPDRIAFTVKDDATAGGPALTSSPAAISISVQGVNDPPTAFAQNLGTNEDTPLAFTLTGTDGDPEVVQVLTFAIANGPLHGTVAGFNPATGKGTYIPDSNYHGSDSFTVTVTDDTTAGGPALTSPPATIAIDVVAVNDPPIALSQNVMVTEDGSLGIVLTGDDGYPEVVQVLTFTIATGPLHGQISGFDPKTGSFTYTPDADYAGTDTIAFTVTDDSTAGGPPRVSQTVGTIAITVQGVNDAPSATSQSVGLAEDGSLAIVLAGTDNDPEVVQVLTFAIVSGPLHGQLTNFNPATGTLTYVPAANYNGPDSFTFTVTDDNKAGGPAKVSNQATVAIAVSPVNDRPIAFSQSVSVQGNKSIVIVLTADDGDPEVSQNLTFAITGPSSGTLTPLDGLTTHSGSLRFQYRPNPAYVGSDSFTFTATDDGSPNLTSTAVSVSIAVTRPPDGVIATGAGEGGSPHVESFNARTGARLQSFFAYDPSFTGGVRVAVGDVNNDGIPDIITGAGVGGFPHVKVFSGKDLTLLASFFAFDDQFTGGITVASGDVDGLPGDEIVVGAGPGAGPHVRTFKLVGGPIEQMPGALGSFFAYDSNFTGGVNVAVGNFDGLPGDEIITGAGMGGGPHVKVFGSGGAVLASFFAFPDDGRLGVTVAAGDIDGDGKAEILTGPGEGGGPIPRIFEGGTAFLRSEFPAFNPDYRGGIFVGTVDSDGDGLADLLISPSQSARSVQIFDGENLNLLDEFNAYSSNFLGGVYIAGKG